MKKQKIYILFNDTMNGESIQAANAALNLLLNAWSIDPCWKENLEVEVWLASGPKHLHFLDLKGVNLENFITSTGESTQKLMGDALCRLLKIPSPNGENYYRPQLVILSDFFILDEISLPSTFKRSAITDCLLFNTGYGVSIDFPIPIKVQNSESLNTHIAWDCIKQDEVIWQTEKSHVLAKQIQLAASSGDMNAQAQLAAMYRRGLGVGRNMSEALKWYHSAAQHDHIEAQYELGEFYLLGLAGLLDKQEAEKWYLRAAEGGSADAQYRLGTLHKYAPWKLTNYTEALKWWKLAAEQGHANALIELGKMYLLGRGVEKDPVVAGGYFQQAEKSGNQAAQMHLKQMDNQRAGIQSHSLMNTLTKVIDSDL